MLLNIIQAEIIQTKILDSLKDSPGWEDFASIGFGYTDQKYTKPGLVIEFHNKQTPEIETQRLTQIHEVAREVLGRELEDDELRIETDMEAFTSQGQGWGR